MTGVETRAFIGDFLRAAPRRAALAAIVVAGAALVEGIGLVLLVPLILAVSSRSEAIGEGGGDGGSTAGWAAQAVSRLLAATGIIDTRWRLVAIIATFATLMVIRSVLLALRQRLLAQLELGYLARIQRDLVDRLAAARWERIARLRHARVTQMLGGDVVQIGQAAIGLLQSIVALIMLAVPLLLAALLQPLLTAIALALVAVTALLSRGLIGAARETGAALIGLRMTLLDDAAQFLGALKLSISQNLQFRFAADVAETLEQANAREIHFVDRQNRVRIGLTLLGAVVGAMTAWLGLVVLSVPPATVVVLLLILSRMSGPAALLQTQAIVFVRALPAYSNLRAIEADLGTPQAIGPDAGVLPAGDIVFDDVRYRHGNGSGHGGLSGLSLTIARGRSLGIVGPSGAGKTTFADLLVGLYAPESGTIAIGGQRVNLTETPRWRDRLAYVSQDPFLLHASIRENLRWGTQADDAAIGTAIEFVGAASLLARLPEGLDTVVGERGTLLSGGERQRLAIARAILRRPSLLILDEATNAIDIAGEAALLARIEALRPALTIVSIAHRAETLARCDRIVTLAGGRIEAVAERAGLDDADVAASSREARS